MRVWDLSAGYLNRQSLLGEHRELHGIYSIVRENKTGYANHPETVRWVRTLSGLAMRHRQLAAEMAVTWTVLPSASPDRERSGLACS
jgi:pyrimidine dimer DNA glycosylase